MPIAYSYKRFSSDAQSQGDSLRRQTELAQKYIDNHPELGLVLDTALNLTDLGVSAFTGDNMTAGALGKFLEAVYKGHIRPGSYLLIESFDRFSRQQANVAAGELLNLVNKGIVVVTLNNEQVYRAEDFNEGTNGLVAFLGAFIAMEGAHREQVNKGKRIAAAWSNKWKQLVQETQSGGKPQKLHTKRLPFWLDEELNPIGDKVAIVKEIYRLRAQGLGKTAIANHLNNNLIPTPKGRKTSLGTLKPWNPSTIARLLTSQAAAGIFENTHGETLEGYYPKVVDDLTLAQVRAFNRTPSPRGQSESKRHPLTGLVKHLQCGQVMRRINKGAKGGAIKLSCIHCKVSRPFTLMLDSIGICLGHLQYVDGNSVEDRHTAEILDLQSLLFGLDEELEEAYETNKRLKSYETKQRYEQVLVQISEARAKLAELQQSNLAVILNIENSVLEKDDGRSDSALTVIAQCTYDSANDLLSIKTISGRVTSFKPSHLEEFSKK